MKGDEMTWEELNEGLEALLIISEFEKICGEIPKHRIKIFATYNIGQWLERLHIFKKGYKLGLKTALRRFVNSGWLKPDYQKKLEEQLKELVKK